jgi:DNA-binding transcriptional LysR family regulator
LFEYPIICRVNIAAIDLNLLVAFDALMTERNVTRAAAKVGLSQPALSNALARLRHHFGDRLFVRGRNAMIPTPRALELGPGIQLALSQLGAALGHTEFRPSQSSARFAIGATEDIEVALIPALMRRLHADAPLVSIACSRLQGIFRVPETDLQSGALDAAIGAFSSTAPLEPGVSAEKLYDARYVCLIRSGHPAARQPLTLRNFCAHRHVTTFYPGVGPGMIDRLLAERGLKRRVALSVPHFLSVPFVVARTDLVATVPDVVARALARRLGLRVLKCPVPLPQLSVSLVWHLRTHDAAPHAWLRRVIVDAAQTLVKSVPLRQR